MNLTKDLVVEPATNGHSAEAVTTDDDPTVRKTCQYWECGVLPHISGVFRLESSRFSIRPCKHDDNPEERWISGFQVSFKAVTLPLAGEDPVGISRFSTDRDELVRQASAIQDAGFVRLEGHLSVDRNPSQTERDLHFCEHLVYVETWTPAQNPDA